MESFWLFVITSFLLNGSLRGQETNLTSGCIWDKMYSYSCTSTGITDLQGVGQDGITLPSWPHSPRLLKTMKHINLSNNKISSLHFNTFYKFLSLETLNVSNNYISKVSINYDLKGKDAIFASLHTLVIDRNRLTFVPKGLGKLNALQSLHLSANSIVRIQRDDFANCTHLQSLDLGDNRIYKIDADAFRDLRNLQVLRLSSNALVSISPLVFLYGHILRADIDLSHNRWACDCRILPLKQLYTSLPLGIKKEWNVTCNTPSSRAGVHLFSIDNINGSCKLPADKYIYARKTVVRKRENIYLPCNLTNNTGLKKAFWWTPQGIISGGPSLSNHYIDTMNTLILTEPDRSHDGLYICIADTERIAYQVYIQIDTGKMLIRRPRDTQLLNARIRTDDDFARAVALSVVITFFCAFLLGVFLRPCLEWLWRKLCKSEDSKKKTSTEAYDNEGFSEENVSRRHNGQGSSLPVHVSKDNSTSEAGFEEPDSTNYENITYNEREIYYKEEHCDLDTQATTHSVSVEDKSKNAYVTGNSHSTKRVTWASNVESSPKVNLKHVISLLKPINIIVPETQMENTDYHDQSITERKLEHGYLDTVIPKKNRGSFSDSTISDESEFWDPEDLLTDENIIVKNVSTQQVGSTSNGHVVHTVNLQHVMSLLKPINFIVPGSTNPETVTNYHEGLSDNSYQFKDINQDLYESSLSDDGSSSSIEDHSSEEDSTPKENDSPKVNIKHVMSLVKPINIVVPEFTHCDIVKSPKQKQFPIVLPSYPEYTIEYNKNQDIKLYGASQNLSPKDTIGKKPFYDSSSSDYENDYSNSSIIPNTNREVKQTFYDSSSSEDGSADERSIKDSVLLTTKQETWRTKETDASTVNLKQIMTLIKPINIIVPGPSISDLVNIPAHKPFDPNSLSRYPQQEMEAIDNIQYQDDKHEDESAGSSYHSSSSDDGSIDFDDSSDEAITLNSTMLSTKQASQKTNADACPTVNLQQVISLLKPINIIAPKSPVSDLEINILQGTFYPSGIPSQPERVEERDNPYNNYPDMKQSSTRPTYMEGKKTSSDSSSSEDESKKDEKHHRSDKGNIIPPVLLPKKGTWAKEENITTVNLKHFMSLVKPINITLPESTVRDSEKTLSPIHFIPTSVPIYPEHRKDDNLHYYDSSSSDDGLEFDYNDSSDEEVKMYPGPPLTKPTSWTSKTDVGPTVNLQQSIALLKPINIIAPTIENFMEDRDSLPYQLQELGNQSSDLINEHMLESSTIPTYDMEGRQTSSDSSSSEDEEDCSSDEKSQPVWITTQETRSKQQNDSPTVNLKHVMSLIKPINITFPEPTKIDIVKSHSQAQFFPGSISRYPEPSMEYLYYDQDMKLSEEAKNKPYNEDQSSNKSPTLPISHREGKNTYYDSSSSDDTVEASSDEEVKMIPGFLPTKPSSWTRRSDARPTVNLHEVMSLLKPISIIAPNFDNIIEERDNLLKVPQEFGDESPDPHYEHSFISSTRPTHYVESKKSLSDSSSSEEDYSSDEGYIISSVLLTKQETLETQENVIPTVNLKHLMSLVKPINITFQECTKIPLEKIPLQTQILPGNIFQYQEPSMEDTDSMYSFPDMNLPGESEHKPYNKDYSSDESPTLPMSGEEKKTSYDSSSSDDTIEASSDEEVTVNSGLLVTRQPTWTSKGNESLKVNLRQVISLLKPINIFAPNYTVTGPVESPSEEQFFQPGSINYEDPLPSPLLRNDSKQSYYDSSSSEEDSKDDHTSEESIKNSDLFITNQTMWTPDENISPTVNFRHAMSLVRPISIIVPEYPSEKFTNPSQKQFFPNVIPRKQEYEVEDIQLSSPIDQSHSASSSSSDDESEKDHSSDEGGAMYTYLPTTNAATWTTKNVERPSVNLKQVMSLLKPIHIVLPEPVTDLKMYYPHGHQYSEQYGGIENQSKEENYEKHYSDIFTRPTIHKGYKEILYDSSSSDNCSDKEGEKSSDEDVGIHSDSLVTMNDTGARTENISPNVNLKSLMSLVNPINIKVPDSTVTEALRRFREKYNVQVREYQRVNQLQNTTLKDPSIDQLNTPRTIIDEISKPFVYEIDQASDASKGNTKLLTWEYETNSNPKVNLKHNMSLLKPINIIAPDSTSTMDMKSPVQKYIFNLYQTEDRMENTDTYHPHQGHQDNRFHTGNSINKTHNASLKGLNSSNPEVVNTFYHRSSESSEMSYKGDIKHSALLTSSQATSENSNNTSPKLNLRHAISLLKPINIVVPDSTLTDTVENPAKVLLGDRLSHNTISEYYTDNINDSSSEEGSFFSFSQSNSLSGDSERIDIARDDVVSLIDIRSSKSKKEMHRGKTSLQKEESGNASPGTRKGGIHSTVNLNVNVAQRDEDLKDFAGGVYEPDKAKDVLHWLNTNTNDELNNEFPTQTSEQELVFDLNEHEWKTRTIIKKVTMTTSKYESHASGKNTYLIPDFGETNADANLIDLDTNESLPQLDVKIEKVVSSAVEHSMPKHQGSYFTNRKKVFDAFSESLKN